MDNNEYLIGEKSTNLLNLKYEPWIKEADCNFCLYNLGASEEIFHFIAVNNTFAENNDKEKSPLIL